MGRDLVEQEIWDDFKQLSGSSLEKRLTYSESNSYFGVIYEDYNSLVHNGISKKLEYDEDFKINQFLLNHDEKNMNWDDLAKLYPKWTKIQLPSYQIKHPQAKLRTIKEREIINKILLNTWEENKNKLHLKIPNENSARDYLIEMRWDGDIICPYCGHKGGYIIENGKRFKCKSPNCYKKFSVTVGTIFEATNLDLIKWYEGMFLLGSIHTSKISTMQLSKALNVPQKTSWGMVRKIKSKVNDELLHKLQIEILTSKIFRNDPSTNKGL